MVDVDRTGTSPDRNPNINRTGTSPDLNPNITILDSDTGTDQANSQRDEALHQFYNSNMAASYPCKA